MDLVDLLFPQQSQADSLRNISQNVSRLNNNQREANAALPKLQVDVGTLSLILLALISRLIESGAVTPAQLYEKMQQLDSLDGLVDGEIDPNVLRRTLGLIPRTSQP